MVQTLVSPRASVPVQPTAPVSLYPATAASSTLYAPALRVTSVPLALPGKVAGTGAPPVTVMLKSAAPLFPPLSLMTVLITVRWAGWSSFVIVQICAWPSTSVPLHPSAVAV